MGIVAASAPDGALIGQRPGFNAIRDIHVNVSAETCTVVLGGWLTETAYASRNNSIPGDDVTIVLDSSNPVLAATFAQFLTTVYTAVGQQINAPGYTGPLAGGNVVADPVFIPDVVSGITEGATPAAGTLPLTWSAPNVDGIHGAATGYLTSFGLAPTAPGTPISFGTAVAVTTPAQTFTGLTSGASVYVQIVATNGSGSGPSVTVGPFAVV